jgi:large subunit ribosomal protein L25
MEQFAITAQRRDSKGTGAARQSRREGLVPCVIYGHGQESASLLVQAHDLLPILRHHGGTIINLNIEGTKQDKEFAALLRDVQRDPVSREVLSVDFQWISLKEAVTLSVPVALVGEAPGVKLEGGALEQVLFEISISCMPNAVPANIPADISSLNVGGSLHVSDLPIPEGVEFLTGPEETVVVIARSVTAADLESRITEEGEGLPVEGAAAEESSEE